MQSLVFLILFFQSYQRKTMVKEALINGCPDSEAKVWLFSPWQKLVVWENLHTFEAGVLVLSALSED